MSFWKNPVAKFLKIRLMNRFLKEHKTKLLPYILLK